MDRLKLLGLARVSTESQAGQRNAAGVLEGLERQRVSIEALARGRGAELIGIVEVADVSGSDLAKTNQWREVLTRLKGGVHLAVDQLDRLIRADKFDLRVLQDLAGIGANIYTPAQVFDIRDNADDVLFAAIKAAIGGREKAEIKRRTRAGKEVHRRQGRWVVSPKSTPRGTRFTVTKEEGSKTESWAWTYDNEKAEPVRRAYQEAATGRPLAAVARDAGMTANVLRYVLRNPIYRGILRFDTVAGEPYDWYPGRRRRDGSVVMPGTQMARRKEKRRDVDVIEVRVFGGDCPLPQLVPDELWFAVQSRLDASRAARRRIREAAAPLVWASGLLHSAHETVGLRPPGGESFYWELTIGGPDATPVPRRRHVIYGRGPGVARTGDRKWSARYDCACAHTPRADRCGFKSMSAEVLHRALDHYFSLLTGDGWLGDAARVLSDFPDSPVGDRARLEAAIAALDRKEKRDLALYDAERIDLVEFGRRQDDVREKRRRLREQLEGLDLAPAPATMADVRRAVTDAPFDATWTPDQKRAWMISHVDSVLLHNDGIRRVSLVVTGSNGVRSATNICWESLLPWRDVPAAPSDGRRGISTADAARRLGEKEEGLRWLMQLGVVARPIGRLGRSNKLVWTEEEVEAARAAIRRYRGEGVEQRWGLPVQETYRATEVATAMGITFHRLKYLLRIGRVAEPPRDSGGYRVWSAAEVEALVAGAVR